MTEQMHDETSEVMAVSARDAFDFDHLKAVCEVHEMVAGHEWGMEKFAVKQRAPHDYYWFRDNGASILAVAHLDTVVAHEDRTATLVEKAGIVFSGALDDRLGAYVITHMLPAMGIECDWLFTVGEENGMSTAEFFDPAEHGKEGYNWIIEFDRGGTDVVLYQYEDEELVDRVEATGVDVAQGIFSDISSMESLGTKAINWGVGYRDYHSTRGHVWLEDLFFLIDAFAEFHDAWADTAMPHTASRDDWLGYGWGRSEIYSGEVYSGACEASHWGVGDCLGSIDHHEEVGLLCERHTHWYDNT